MCPACLATAGIVIGSVVSTGGVAALVAKMIGKRKGEKNESKTKEQGL